MADVFGVNYEKEWINDPAEQADKGSRNASEKCQLEKLSGINDTDKLYLYKLQNIAVLTDISALVGALGAGDLEAIDQDGNATVIEIGDEIDGQIEGGLDIVLTADGATSSELTVLLKFLMD
jgi:hypothetical protein